MAKGSDVLNTVPSGRDNGQMSATVVTGEEERVIGFDIVDYYRHEQYMVSKGSYEEMMDCVRARILQDAYARGMGKTSQGRRKLWVLRGVFFSCTYLQGRCASAVKRGILRHGLQSARIRDGCAV